jgi:putative serine protease PepD
MAGGLPGRSNRAVRPELRGFVMVDASSQDLPEPDPGRTGSDRRRSARVATAIVVVAVLVLGGLVMGAIAARGRGTSATARAASSSQAMCPAVPVAAKVLPSVVTISAASASGSAGTGSGELIATGGYILTNDHVIAVAANGGPVSVLYSDGQTSPASIVGRDPLTDVAVIKAADGGAGLPVIPTTSSAAVVVGQPVVALGAPLGLASTVTSGIVSALDRYVPVPGENGQTAHLVGAIQTDAAINPGNSGGALVDCSGRMVGMNTAIATVPNAQGVSGGGSVGLGFAIPIDLAKPLAEQIIRTGRVVHPSTGMQVQAIPPSATEQGAVPGGLYVQAVTPGGPAAAAGIRAGDVITHVDGHPAVSSEQVTVATIGKQPGDTIRVTYVRGGQSNDATITLA